MKRLQLRDVIKLGAARRTGEGFIEAEATFSRTGCQDYTRRELGLDGDPNQVITLYRPPEEVGSPESVRSLDGKPLTLNHPPEDVNADNWKRYAIGDAHGVKFDGEVTKGRAIIRDRDGVRAYDAGTRELSVGYSFDLDMTPGTAPDGKKYHGVQRNIRGNHHAVVDEGRCGGKCRVGDDSKKKTTECGCSGGRKGNDTMAIRVIKIADSKIGNTEFAGFEIELDVSTPAGAKAADALDRHARGLKDCMDAYKSLGDEVGIHRERADAAEKRLAQLDAMPDEDDEDEDGEDSKGGKDGKPKAGDRAVAYVGRLKARAAAAKDEKLIAARAAERQKAIDGATKVIGDDFKADGKSVKEIRVAAVAKALETKDSAIAAIAGDILEGVEPAKAGDAALAAAFNATVAYAKAHAADSRHSTTDAERDAARALAGTDPTGGAGAGAGGNGSKPKLVGHDHLMNRMFGGGQAAS